MSAEGIIRDIGRSQNYDEKSGANSRADLFSSGVSDFSRGGGQFEQTFKNNYPLQASSLVKR